MIKASKKTNKAILEQALPKAIDISGTTFQIKIKAMKDVHGECWFDKKTINIDSKQNVEQALQTLFHEYIHALLYISGINELLTEEVEESFVRCIENGVWKLIDSSKLRSTIPMEV